MGARDSHAALRAIHNVSLPKGCHFFSCSTRSQRCLRRFLVQLRSLKRPVMSAFIVLIVIRITGNL